MDNAVRLLLLPVGAALLVACGSSSGTTTAGSTAPSSASVATTTLATTAMGAAGTLPDGAGESTPTDQPEQGDVQEIMINVDDASQVGKTIPVKLGQTVVLRLLSDTDQTYHVHGYDLEQTASAGVEASFEFLADQAGSFEVESHTTDKVLAVLKVS